jgi:transcriptional regulator with XRE-family HTH domain
MNISEGSSMAKRKEIVEMLKKSLKANGITYADVAERLGLSEISIKRNFSQKNFTLDRIDEICEIMKIDLTDLVRLADDERKKISTLKVEQEQELVADLKFLLVAICVQNAWQMDEIIEYYDISKAECIRYLIRLDRQGLIHFLPNNRIRRTLAHDFRWLPQGPIETFFEKNVQNEFMGSHFTKGGELRIYMIGMLSRNSLNTLKEKMQLLAREYSSLQQDDARLPARSRFNTGMMMAIRPWELSVFATMKRVNNEKSNVNAYSRAG